MASKTRRIGLYRLLCGFLFHCYSRPETIAVNDHDFGSAGSGVVIPHGIYDVGLNRGYVHLNTSHDTSELACDSL